MDQYVCLPDWWRMEGFLCDIIHIPIEPDDRPSSDWLSPRQGTHTYLPVKRWRIAYWWRWSMEPLMDKSSDHVVQPLERRLKPRSALSQLPMWREPLSLSLYLSVCGASAVLGLCARPRHKSISGLLFQTAAARLLTRAKRYSHQAISVFLFLLCWKLFFLLVSGSPVLLLCLYTLFVMLLMCTC